MSQWLDMVAANSVGATTKVDTSGVSLPSIFGRTAATVSGAAKSVDATINKTNTMLWLTAAGVVIAAYAVWGKRRG